MAKWIPLLFTLALGCSWGCVLNSDARSVTGETPGDTLQDLSSRTRDWSEPSINSEDRYVNAMKDWLTTLPKDQRECARTIMSESHPHLSQLRQAIREKKAELASISFDRGTSPETLSRLGVELRSLQTQLRHDLEVVSRRLKNEAGIKMSEIPRQTFWLTPGNQN